MYLYSNARGGTTTPALNALATILVVVTLVGVGVAFLVYRCSAATAASAEEAGRARCAS